MPSFTVKYPNLVNVLKTYVQVSQFGNNNWKQCTAIWDTGATASVITSDVAKELGLIPISRGISRGVNGEKVVPVYAVSINLPNNVVFNIPVSEGEPGGGWDLLIGMDVISNGDFCVSNFAGQTTFSFRIPSEEATDYVKISKDKNAAIKEDSNKDSSSVTDNK